MPPLVFCPANQGTTASVGVPLLTSGFPDLLSNDAICHAPVPGGFGNPLHLLDPQTHPTPLPNMLGARDRASLQCRQTSRVRSVSCVHLLPVLEHASRRVAVGGRPRRVSADVGLSRSSPVCNFKAIPWIPATRWRRTSRDSFWRLRLASAWPRIELGHWSAVQTAGVWRWQRGFVHWP